MHDILSLIGNTPILKINIPQIKNNIFAKCELFNPSLSIKDRIVFFMIKELENCGKLLPGATIYEASSGNTGNSLAMIGTLLGYKVIITVPDKTSLEKKNFIKMFGADVIECKSNIESTSSEHYYNVAKTLSTNDKNSLFLNQYESNLNVLAHYNTTGKEIWQQMKGKIDYFICAASTGGTITGVAKYLKEQDKTIKIILADPVGSIFYNHFYKLPHKYFSSKIEGAGKDKIHSIHDFSNIDDVMQFTDEDAYQHIKLCAQYNGIFIGGSSGGILSVACELAKKINNKLNIVIIFPDSGFKYLSKLKL